MLSDGQDTDSTISLDSLVARIGAAAREGGDDAPVRIFPIAYGEGADTAALQRIAEATGGQWFDASDAAKIDLVFASVINNFYGGTTDADRARRAGGYVDDAVDGARRGQRLRLVRGAGRGGADDQLEAQIGDASIGVAVFSDNAALEASGPEIVAELAAAHPEYDTIIVAVGDDLSAGSRVLEPGEAMRIANEAEASAGRVDDALTQTIQGVIARRPDSPRRRSADAGAS